MHPNAQPFAERVGGKIANDVGFVSDVGIAGAKVANGFVDQASACPVDGRPIGAVGEIAAAANARAKPAIARRLIIHNHVADASVGDRAVDHSVGKGESGRSRRGGERGDGVGGHPKVGDSRIVEGRRGKSRQGKQNGCGKGRVADASGGGVEEVLEFVGVALVGLCCCWRGAVLDVGVGFTQKHGGLGAAAQNPEAMSFGAVLAGIDVDVQLRLALFN